MAFLGGIMGPLGKEYCNILLVLGILLFVLAVIALFGLIVALFNKKIRWTVLHLAPTTIIAFIQYYMVRILYNMCMKSL